MVFCAVHHWLDHPLGTVAHVWWKKNSFPWQKCVGCCAENPRIYAQISSIDSEIPSFFVPSRAPFVRTSWAQQHIGLP